MNIEQLRAFCKKLPGVTEDIKWEHDLCFCIGAKMFLVVGLTDHPTSASFKATDEDFEELIAREGMQPAAYLARYKWVGVSDTSLLNKKEWEHYIKQAYELIKAKLPKKVLNNLPG